MFYHKSIIVYNNTGQIADQFPIELFEGYDTAIVETYSVSISFLRAFTDDGGWINIDIVYGDSDKLLNSGVRLSAAMLPKHSDAKLLSILQKVEKNDEAVYGALTADRLRMFVSRAPSHKKLFLLSRKDGARRAILGSANASINGVCGMKEEALAVWDGGPICDELFLRGQASLTAARPVELAESISWIKQARTETLL